MALIASISQAELWPGLVFVSLEFVVTTKSTFVCEFKVQAAIKTEPQSHQQRNKNRNKGGLKRKIYVQSVGPKKCAPKVVRKVRCL